MTGKVVSEHANVEVMQNGTVKLMDSYTEGSLKLTNVEVAVTVTFGVAVLQVLVQIAHIKDFER